MDSEPGNGEAGDFANEVKAADDGGFGATASAGDFGGAKEFGAVEAKDLGDGGWRAAAAGIEFFKEGEGGMGDRDGVVGGSGGRRGSGRGERECPGG